MTIKASARSTMIIAAGLLIGFAAPIPASAAGADGAAAAKSEAATPDKSVRQGSRTLKKRYAHRKTIQAASKSAESRKADEKEVADASVLPESVANANARMMSADAAPDSAKAMSAAMSEKANSVLLAAADKPADAETPAEAAADAPEQPNDVDRALHANPADATTPRTVALASAAPKPADAQAANDSSTLDRTSLIGKVFIAIGTLLTVASAARMLMA